MHKKLVGLLALALLIAPVGAQATLITYDFGVTATGGPLTGTSAAGTFSFDDSIIPTGGGFLSATGLLADLDFTWNGIVYDETTANTGALGFDAGGNLTLALFGTTCNAGTCFVSRNTENWAVRVLTNQIFAYSTPSSETVYYGTAYANRVPEPAAFALLGIGLVGLGLANRKKT